MIHLFGQLASFCKFSSGLCQTFVFVYFPVLYFIHICIKSEFCVCVCVCACACTCVCVCVSFDFNWLGYLFETHSCHVLKVIGCCFVLFLVHKTLFHFGQCFVHIKMVVCFFGSPFSSKVVAYGALHN